MTSRNPWEDLASSLAATPWPALLPPSSRESAQLPAGSPRLVDALWLSGGSVLVLLEDGDGRLRPVPCVVHGGEVRRARPGDGAAEALVGLLGAGGSHQGRFVLTSWQQREVEGERPIAVDQTNESLIVGDAAVVKWSASIDAGPHPAPSLLAALRGAGFRGTPEPWGALEWLPDAAAAPRLVALVTGYVDGAVDGWTWAVEMLTTAATSGELAPVVETARAVGQLVASFHVALAPSATPATPQEVSGWLDEALADLERALEVTTGDAHRIVSDHADQLRASFTELAAERTLVMRVHGDLHVGQVLHAGSGAYLLTDFEGNPVVPPGRRSRPQPAALDVAGMSQSLVHAGVVARRHHPDIDAARLEAVAALAVTEFQDSYRTGLGEHDRLLDRRLLRPFSLQQVCREFVYAATHLPRWSYVPEAVLPAMLAEEAS